MSNQKIAVIGGDMRQLSMAEALACRAGRSVVLYGIHPSFADSPPEGVRWVSSVEEACTDAHAVILPLPASVNHVHIHCPLGESDLSIDELFTHLNRSVLLLGGRLDEAILSRANASGLQTIDYALTDEFARYNALPTAEGALEIALNELPITIRDSRMLICGFGRVGRELAFLLQSLGAHVTVAARRPEIRAEIRSAGMTAIALTQMGDGIFDGVFNTVPEPIIGEIVLCRWPRKTLLVELASRPGGFDQTAAESLGMNVIFAPGLPGKTAPVSAGRILASCVESQLKEVEHRDQP